MLKHHPHNGQFIADEHAKDRARILRLPGYINWKSGETAQLRYLGFHEPVSAEDFKDAFGIKRRKKANGLAHVSDDGERFMAKECLKGITPKNYGEWFRCLCAIKNIFGISGESLALRYSSVDERR